MSAARSLGARSTRGSRDRQHERGEGDGTRQLARRLYEANAHIFEDETEARCALGLVPDLGGQAARWGAFEGQLNLHSERRHVATRFGRDFWDYELVVRNAGPGVASSIGVTPVPCGMGWAPRVIGRVTDLTGAGTIIRLGPGDTARLGYETVDDDHLGFTWLLRWVDADGERCCEFPASKNW